MYRFYSIFVVCHEIPTILHYLSQVKTPISKARQAERKEMSDVKTDNILKMAMTQLGLDGVAQTTTCNAFYHTAFVTVGFAKIY